MLSDYLPLELFAKILSDAVHSDDDDGSKALARAVLLSTVSRHWRHVVTSLPELWTHLHTNTHSTGPLTTALARSNGHFQSISLDLTPIAPQARAEHLIAVFDLVVKQLCSKDVRWHTLSFITDAQADFSSLSHYLDGLFLHDSPVISSITTLRLTFLSPQQQYRSIPRFSTLVFPNLARVHTSNVLLSLNPSVAAKLRQPFEVHLYNWKTLLDSTTILIPNSSSSQNNQNSTPSGTRHRFNYHLVIHDALPNTYSFERLELWDVGALTININNPSSSNSDSEFLQFWSKIGFPKLRYLEVYHSSSEEALATIKKLVDGTFTFTPAFLFPRLWCLVVKQQQQQEGTKIKGEEEKQKLVEDATQLKKVIPSLQRVVVVVQDVTTVVGWSTS